MDGVEWYEERQTGLGWRFVEEVDAAFDRLSTNPASYQEVLPGVHRTVVHVFPYLVFFTFDLDAIHILAVVPAAQDPGYTAERLGQPR